MPPDYLTGALALYAQRKATGSPEIDLIDTSTDAMSNIDEGNANFNITGWDGHSLVYLVNRNGYQPWQSKAQALKSYNADSKKLTILDETVASGNSTWYGSLYYEQIFGGVTILGTEIIYAQGVQTDSTDIMQGKQAQLISIQPDGSNKKIIKTYSYPLTGSFFGNTLTLNIDQSTHDPTTIYFQASASSWNGNYRQGTFDNSVYQYQGGQVKQRTDLTSIYSDNEQYTTYLLSPSGKQTFWTVYADGKKNLTTGDQNGQNPKTIVAGSDYSPYGWFSDQYLLVQKSNNELYIMSSDGTSQPFKITNFY
jgi:hypothetical protein